MGSCLFQFVLGRCPSTKFTQFCSPGERVLACGSDANPSTGYMFSRGYYVNHGETNWIYSSEFRVGESRFVTRCTTVALVTAAMATLYHGQRSYSSWRSRPNSAFH